MNPPGQVDTVLQLAKQIFGLPVVVVAVVVVPPTGSVWCGPWMPKPPLNRTQ